MDGQTITLSIKRCAGIAKLPKVLHKNDKDYSLVDLDLEASYFRERQF